MFCLEIDAKGERARLGGRLVRAVDPGVWATRHCS